MGINCRKMMKGYRLEITMRARSTLSSRWSSLRVARRSSFKRRETLDRTRRWSFQAVSAPLSCLIRSLTTNNASLLPLLPFHKELLGSACHCLPDISSHRGTATPLELLRNPISAAPESCVKMTPRVGPGDADERRR